MTLSPTLIVQRAALRFELQSARGAVLNAQNLAVMTGTPSDEELEAICIAPLAPLHAALHARLAAPPLDAETVAMARDLVREMADRFRGLTRGVALQERTGQLFALLAAPNEPVAAAPAAIVAESQDEIEIQAIVHGPRMPLRSIVHERRVEEAQRQFDARDPTQLLAPLAGDQRTAETVLVCGKSLHGELVVRRTAHKNDAVDDVLRASSIADHWFAALRGGGDGELMSLVRDRQLAYAVRVHVPQIGDIVVAAHAGLWQLGTPEHSCATAAAPLRAALVRFFGSERVLQCMFESVEQWQAHELRNWRARAEQTVRQQHLLAHERDDLLKRCKMAPVFL